MAVEKEILEGVVLNIKKIFEEKRREVLSEINQFFDAFEKELEEEKTPSIDAREYLSFTRRIIDMLMITHLYVDTLEKLSFSKVIEAYQERYKEELKQTEELQKQVSEKTKQLFV